MTSALALACTVCVGDPASPMTRAAAAGTLFLLAVIGGVLAAIAWTAFSWSRRARRLSRENGPC
jgi:hypothetical protein